GRNWLSSSDDDKRRRLEDPNDFVRIEIETALDRGIPVIPVLVDGAAMPRAGDLPDSLKLLSRRKAIEISESRFDSDVEELARAVARLVEDRRKATAAERAVKAEREESSTDAAGKSSVGAGAQIDQPPENWLRRIFSHARRAADDGRAKGWAAYHRFR